MRVVLFVTLLLSCSNAFAHDYSKWLNKCEAYRETVEAIIDREGIERDYYYLMVAESKCTINAESEKGAKGFWQLMPATSRHYGCNDLHDIECSTTAAIKYIKHLKERFKTFRDVIYAYNMGGHNYERKGASGEAIGLYNRIMEIKKYDNK